MRKLLAISVTVLLAAFVVALPTYANDNITVTIDGQLVSFEGQNPVIVDGRTLVPVRGVFEQLGFAVVWDGEAQKATLTSGDYAIVLSIGSDVFTTNGASHTLDVPAQIIGGRTMLPLRAVLESAGYYLNWNATVQTVEISSPVFIQGVRYNSALSSLTLNDMELAEEDVAQLLQMRNLTSLNLDGSRVGDLAPLIGLTSLATLSLNDMDLTDEEIVPLQYMTTLTNLSLDGNNIRDLAPLGGLPNLTSLSLSNNLIRNFTAVEHIANVTRGQQRLSSITLPNRRLTAAERQEWIDDYLWHGGPTLVELEVVRLVNIERANHNLSRVAIDDTLMMAARFFAQQANDLRGLHSGTHNFGPYASNPSASHGASANVAAAFGANLRWNGGNWFSSGSMSAESLVNGWMNSDGHRRYMLSPEHRFIGVGQYPGGISYMYLNERASN